MPLRIPELLPIPAFDDNYIWLIHDALGAVAVDPGDAEPILAWLDEHGVPLEAILVTHHHGDHTGGIPALVSRFKCPVYGPAAETIRGLTHGVGDGDRIRLRLLPDIRVIGVPGHTLGHVAYVAGHWLFSGDALFSCGCGRLFEGTAAQLHASLCRLASLPDDTVVCCAHEYTLSNIRFALHVDGGNASLRDWESRARILRHERHPTLPVRLDEERLRNPFLRCGDATIQARIFDLTGHSPAGAETTFALMRELKNTF